MKRMNEITLMVIASLIVLVSGCASSSNNSLVGSPQATAEQQADLLITNARVYSAPGEPAFENQTLVINSGRISAIRTTGLGDGQIDARQTIDAQGMTVSAGLWNSHVHFTSERLADDPQAVINNMLLRYGFTHVVDTGSILPQTLGLRSAIAGGELRGPQIVLANGSFVYTDGTPSYLPGIKLPEVSSVAAAAPMVNATLDAGADGIKIFSGSFMSPTHTIHLPTDIIQAITQAAKAKDRFVMAHPTTIRGLTNAVRGGVDVIAHTTAPEVEVPPEVLNLMRQQNTALIPTLALWRYEMEKFNASPEQAEFMENAAVSQLGALHAAGVEILFGTDVGYKTEFDTAAEYKLMGEAGMDWPAIHHSLTVGPAKRFGKFVGDQEVLSRVSVGAPAHLVLLEGDPAIDIEALSRVAFTIVSGDVVYAASPTY